MTDETTAADPAGDPALSPVTGELRFTAPDHVGGFTFSSGRVAAVVAGIMTLPDDLTASERDALALYGFTAA